MVPNRIGSLWERGTRCPLSQDDPDEQGSIVRTPPWGLGARCLGQLLAGDSVPFQKGKVGARGRRAPGRGDITLLVRHAPFFFFTLTFSAQTLKRVVDP